MKALKLLKIYEKTIYLDELLRSMSLTIENQLSSLKLRSEKARELLRVLDPKNILGRGYTLLKDCSGKVISSKKSFEDQANNTELNLMFHDGEGLVRKK